MPLPCPPEIAALAVIGNLARDVVDGGRPRVGGGPFHAGRTLRLLGIPARLITKCTADDRDGLLRDLVALGLPVSWRPASATATFTIRYDGERRTMELEQLGEPWSVDDARGWVAEALAGVQWLHVAPLARSDFGAETLAALARGRRLSLDGQGLVRRAQRGPLELDGDFDPAVLRHVSALKLAEDEAELVLAELGDSAVGRLGVPEVIVTLGSRGSVVYWRGVRHSVRARAVDADPTGAGDAFMAAYAAHRSRGHRPVTAAESATRLVEALLRGRLR